MGRQTEPEDARVMALDAALNRTGYAIHCGSRLVAVGVFKVNSKLSLQDKLLAISQWVAAGIEQYGIKHIVLEGCYSARNMQTAHHLSMVHGAIITTAAIHHVTTSSIPPSTVKKRITGSGNADKKQVAEMVTGRYADDLAKLNIPLGVLSSDMTDALAVYCAYALEREEPCNNKTGV